MIWDDLRLRLRSLILRRRAERELDDELRFHLDMEARKNQDAGADPAQAAQQALRNFGGLEQRRTPCFYCALRRQSVEAVVDLHRTEMLGIPIKHLRGSQT